MKATGYLFHGKGSPLEAREIPLPSRAPGESIVRVTHCALCRSDLHTFSGRRVEPTPTILGHEIIGIVVESDDLDLLGKRVTWGIAAFCGECFYCQNGLPQKCLSLFKYGHSRETEASPLSGGLATHVLIRKGTSVFEIPDGLPDEAAVLANCSTATAAAVIRAGEPCPGMRVLVMGAGVLGLTASAMLSDLGCRPTLFDPVPEAAKRAKDFGAVASCSSLDELHGIRQDETDGRGFDLSLELSGFLEAVETALSCVRIGGRVVLAGTASPVGTLSLQPEQIVRKMLTITGVHNYAPQDLKQALRFLEQRHKVYPFGSLIAAACPLNEAQSAFEMAEAMPGRRVVLCPDPTQSEI